MLKKTARAPAATFSAVAIASFIFPLVRLGKLAPDAALECGDVEVGRRVDDPARPRDRLLDDELAALESAIDDRGERGLDAPPRRQQLVEDDRVLERDRR